MIDYIMNFPWNGTLGILLYWVPAAMCLYGYTVRTWKQYQKDIAARAKAEDPLLNAGTQPMKFYHPSLTVGDVLVRLVSSVLPIFNLCAAIFDVSPEVFRSLFRWLREVFDQPLVPERKTK